MRILRIADVEAERTAGMSGLMLATSDQMASLGHEVKCWFRRDLAPGLQHAGLRRLLIPWLIAVKVLWAQAREGRFEVVEIHEPLGAPYALPSRLVRRLPACVVISYGLEERGWQARLAWERHAGCSTSLKSRILVPATLLLQARLALRFARAIAVPSSEDRRYLIEVRGAAPDRVRHCSTGVDGELFALRRNPQETMGVLFVGSWVERKGVSVLQAAWRRLDQPGVPPARLTLAGIGASQAALSFAAAHQHVDVISNFSRSELRQLLLAHDVFVLPSWFEGMPLSLLEAAAAGLACVTTAVCGNLDIFRADDPERDGALLVAPGDADALADALLRLAGDARLRADLGVRARERARQFTWQQGTQRLLTAYTLASGAQTAAR